MNIKNTAEQTEQEQAAPVQTEEKPAEGETPETKPAEPEEKAAESETKPAESEEKPEAPKAVSETGYAKIFKALGMPDGISDEDGIRSMADELTLLRGAFEAVSQGANAETASELAAIARAKVTDGKDIKAVISELKTQAAYSGFFKPAPSGTGTSVSGKSHSGSADGSMGARLAKASAPKANTSPYFKH